MRIYSAMKLDIRSLVKTLSLELGGKGITVNAICLGSVETSIWSKMDIPDEVQKDFGA